MADDEFEPRIGRLGKDRLTRSPLSYRARIIRATNRARGGATNGPYRSHFNGSRIGRGSGAARLLTSRDRWGAFRHRRVVIKSRIVGLKGKGLAGANAHLRYLQRDGTTREGAPGELYDAKHDTADGKAFLERSGSDRHQFRFIVSAEDGHEYEDLRPFTRRLMSMMEEDLGTPLEWVAVDHFNTGRPHTHIILRGKDEHGADLIIAREYLTRGMRERAVEIVSLDLGPRTDQDIEHRMRAEVDQERLTGIDRSLLRSADDARLVTTNARDTFEQALRAGRLQKLARLGLATPNHDGSWRLADDMEERLIRLGERGDIIRTMQRALSGRSGSPFLAEQSIYDPRTADRALIGRVIARGLSDELRDRHYLIIEATDGRTHYVDIGSGDRLEPLANNTIVQIEALKPEIRSSDRTIATIAAAGDGRYDIERHLRHDPDASETFAQAHVRRLEALRKRMGSPTRDADGSWIIPADHLDHVETYERERSRSQPVAIAVLSTRSLEDLTSCDGATWLDRNLVSGNPVAREAGFGREVKEAEHQRRLWLIEQGLAVERDGRTDYRSGMLTELRLRELGRVADQLSVELGLEFRDAQAGDNVSGTYRRPIELAGERLALIEDGPHFMLVPWRRALDAQLGREVVGVVRRDGISWTFGRDRSGPAR